MVLRSLATTVMLKMLIEGIWFVQAINTQFVTHERAALADKMCCTMITGLLFGINNAFRIACINLNKVIAAILPSRFFSSPCLGRARVIHPTIKFVRLMHMTQGQVIDPATERLKLGHSGKTLNTWNHAVYPCMHHEHPVLDARSFLFSSSNLQCLSYSFHSARSRSPLPGQTIDSHATI